jgi:Ca2+-binding EF-hand superfamily protein
MFLPLILSAAIVGAQADPVNVTASRVSRGKLFVSPMGEPFYGRTNGEDGLLVWFGQADLNHDGLITAAEMVADADRYFAVLDRQHDGEIDPDDIRYYEAAVVPQVRVQSKVSIKELPGGGVSEQFDDESSSGLYNLLKIPQPVASADRNFDRGVSPEEFRSAARRRFQLLDSGGTGQLSLSQLQGIRRSAIAEATRRPVDQTAQPDPKSAEYGAQPHN